MNPSKLSVRRASFLLASMLVGSSLFGAADDTTTAVPSNSTASVAAQSQDEEIARLKAALAEQQKQLQTLQQMLQNQQQMIEKVTATTTVPAAAAPAATTPAKTPSRLNLGDIASLVPVLPAPVAAPAPVSIALPNPNPQAGSTQNAAGGNPCEAPPDANQVPPYLRIGSVCVVPIGFMDLTPFWRDKAAATGTLGSNFGSVPYNNVPGGNISEYHFSIQNSRLGFRLDGDWKGTHFIGYNEFDFNGTGGATNYGVTNGANVPRIRLYWVDVRKGGIEFLGGQSWSLLTPNRKGLSAFPGDLFYSQVIDINYIAGLTWTRQPGLRVLFHTPKDKINFGFSVEQGDPYMGGSGGGGAITLPAALTGLTSSQLDAGANISGAGYLNQPTFTPDFIAKVAFDPSSRFHFEVAGIESNFHTVALAAPFTHHSISGGALTFGLNAGITKNIRAVASGMFGDGEGRYLFGAAPDLIVRGDGSLSPVHSDSWISGIEATIKNTLLYGYYSGDYIGRNAALDANGTSLIGYGYKGSANSQNRAIQEVTFGFNQTMWKNPRYGAINVMGQYEWLERMPWFVAAGAPKNTHDNTIYFDLRYTLPGSMPNF